VFGTIQARNERAKRGTEEVPRFAFLGQKEKKMTVSRLLRALA
jgi:hypothetical protein